MTIHKFDGKKLKELIDNHNNKLMREKNGYAAPIILSQEIKENLFVVVAGKEEHNIYNIDAVRAMLLKNKLTLFVNNCIDKVEPGEIPRKEFGLDYFLDFTLSISNSYQELLYLSFLLGQLFS